MMTSVKTAPRVEVASIQEKLLAASPGDIRTQFVQLASGESVQTFETGEGDPLVLLHGSGNSAISMLPLMEQLGGRRVIAIDRPGYGLSDPTTGLREKPRATGVRVVAGVLDALGLDRADLLGNSTGGFWTLWTALDRPARVRRVILLGATPLLPGTKPPVPLRLMTTPGISNLLGRILPEPSPKTVQQMMGSMGEAETIVRHPGLIEAYVAAGRDPVAGQASSEELSGVLRGLLGFRPAFRFTSDELAAVEQPTLMIWGDHDPIGPVSAAGRTAALMPSARVEVVATGHAPWLGEAERVAEIVTGFLAEG